MTLMSGRALISCTARLHLTSRAEGSASEPNAATLILETEGHCAYESVAMEAFEKGVEKHNLKLAGSTNVHAMRPKSDTNDELGDTSQNSHIL